MSAFRPTFAQLPGSLSVFPLTGALLLPGGRLPLTIFEPRYLALVQDALAGDRLIGMIQPQEPDRRTNIGGGAEHPPLARVGCAGRIVSFTEMEDGRLLITLAGLCRFHWRGEESLIVGGYRRGRVDWAPFAADMDAEGAADPEPGSRAEALLAPEREALLAALRRYFRRQRLDADWPALDGMGFDRLVTLLAMICPFDPREKQALLEAPDPARRAALLLALVEMAAHDDGDDDPSRH